MKRALSVILALIMVLSLCACGTVDLETVKAVYGKNQWSFYKLLNQNFDGVFALGIEPGMDRLALSGGKITLEYCGRP